MSKRFTTFASFTLVAALLAGLPVSVAAGGPPKPPPHPKADKAVADAADNSDPSDTIKVIVRIKDGAKDAVTAKLERHGHAVNHLPSIASASIEVHVSDLDELGAMAGISGISLDAPMTPTAAPPPPPGPPAPPPPPGKGPAPVPVSIWGDQPPVTLDILRAELGVAAGAPTGQGITVALIDSGIADGPNFEKKIKAFYDFTNGGKKVAPSDKFGHGTHVAGLIGALGKESRGLYAGVAPNVSFVGLKVLDDDGNGSTSNVIAAVQFAVANKAALGIDVINLSLGHPIYEPAATDPLVQAVELAVRSGIVVVVSAGNDGLDASGLPQYGGIGSPGNAPSVITVGATKTSATVARGDDDVADFSSKGPTWFDAFAKPDLVAPGYRMVSVAKKDNALYHSHADWGFAQPAGTGPGDYLRLSGSSMSAGVVSGVVALVLEANRTDPTPDGKVMKALTPHDIKTILEYTATDTGAEVLAQGAGEVNAAGAVALVRALDTRFTPWAVQAIVQTTTIGGQTQAWARTVVWGDNPVTSATPDDLLWFAHGLFVAGAPWGSNSVSANLKNVVWGNAIVSANLKNVVWGNDDLAANARNVVWGNARNVVWGNARNVVWGNSLNLCGSTEVCY